MPSRLSRFYRLLEPKVEKGEVADIPHLLKAFIHLIVDGDEDVRLLLDELDLLVGHELLLTAVVFEPTLGVALGHQVHSLSEILSLLLIGIEGVFDEFLGVVVLLLAILNKSLNGHGFGGMVELFLDRPYLVLHLGVVALVGGSVVMLVVEVFEDELAACFEGVYEHYFFDAVY